MSAVFLVIMVAMAGGAAISFQSLFSGIIGKRLGIVESIFIVHLGGLLLGGFLLLVARGGNISSWRTLPWYSLCAGFLGVVIIGSISYVVPRLGLATTLTITISIQLVLGAIIDHFGLLHAAYHPLDLPRLVGIVILLLGTWLVVR